MTGATSPEHPDTRAADPIAATLADLGVTTHRGPGWAAATVADALPGAATTGPDGVGDALIRGAVRFAGQRLATRIAGVLPFGFSLHGDKVHGPTGTAIPDLARLAAHWWARAGAADVAADLWLWTAHPATAISVEARVDDLATAGHRVAVPAAAAAADYWAVYCHDGGGVADWVADFTVRDDAIRHARRWGLPITLADRDTHQLMTQRHLAARPGVGAVTDAARWLTDGQAHTLAEATLRGAGPAFTRADPTGAIARGAASHALVCASAARWHAWQDDTAAAVARVDDRGRWAVRTGISDALLAVHARDLLTDRRTRRAWNVEAYTRLTWAWACAQRTQDPGVVPCPLPPPPALGQSPLDLGGDPLALDLDQDLDAGPGAAHHGAHR